MRDSSRYIHTILFFMHFNAQSSEYFPFLLSGGTYSAFTALGSLYIKLAEVPGNTRVIIRLAATQTQDTKLISPLKLISLSKLMSHPDRIHFAFTLKLADLDTHFDLPGLPGSMSTPTDLLPSPCLAVPKLVLHSYSQELDQYPWHGHLWSV